MSNNDGFINEVSEAVRQDQLWGYVRKYGWIAGLAILLIVGGAAWNEYNKAQRVASAKAIGDAILTALETEDPQARADALVAIEADGDTAGVTSMLTAVAQQQAGEAQAAAATLDGVASNNDLAPIYRDLATFKSAMLLIESDIPAARDRFVALDQPGAPFRLLAQEQLALLDINEGNTDAAITALRAILEDAEVTQGLRERAQTLIVALGAPLDEAEPEEQEGSN